MNMERREQYDPEDIEALLLERPFEDLLPEERAFVLRHLSGQDEYEAMRATLNAVRHLDSERAPITADTAVRDNVMAAFRAQQQPQWRIWLNSVGALFVPKQGHSVWAPTLRIAGVAAVIGVGVWSITRFTDLAPAEMVAEVVHTEEPSPAQPASPTEEPAATVSADQDVAANALSSLADSGLLEKQSNEWASGGIAAADEYKVPAGETTKFTAPVSASYDVAVGSEAEEDVPAVYFDARTLTDSIVDIDRFADAAPAKDLSQAGDGSGVKNDAAAAEQLETITMTEGTATRAERRKAVLRESEKENAELTRDDNSAMANSRSVDQKLLSLQNAAW